MFVARESPATTPATSSGNALKHVMGGGRSPTGVRGGAHQYSETVLNVMAGSGLVTRTPCTRGNNNSNTMEPSSNGWYGNCGRWGRRSA
jgi:hypothetical protein